MKLKIQVPNRETNIELIRVISIIMIIAHHYALYSGFTFGNEVTVNKIIIDIFSAFGKVGVALFIIISGYFYNKSKVTVKKVISLFVQVWLYSIIGLSIGICIGSNELSIENIIKSIFPVIFGRYWFITCYILLYLFSPFLKIIIEKFEKQELKKCILLMCFIWTIIAIIPKNKVYGSDFINFILLYMIGAYISKYEYKFFKNKRQRIIAMLTVIILMISIMIILECIATKIPFISEHVRHFNALSSPLVLVLTVLTFEIFKEIKMKPNSLINIASTTILGIYLIHDNIFLRDIIWEKLIKGANLINYEPIYLICNAIIGILGVFIICAIIDLLMKNTLQKFFIKVSENVYSKIRENIKNKKNRRNVI